MASPFPGMDPYLEESTIWSGFHHALPEEIRAQLNAQIGPKYYADVEVHTVFEEVSISTSKARTIYPDVGILEPSSSGPVADVVTSPVAISPAPIQRAVAAGQVKLRSVRVYATETDELVTAIEVLSPYNKRGAGPTTYREKRANILSANVYLVEIDLLRGGRRPGYEVEDPAVDTADYVLVVNRQRHDNPQRISDIWPTAISHRLPVLPIPLLRPDPDATLDLKAAIDFIYERAGYSWRIDYNTPIPPPNLSKAMATWVEKLLASTQKHSTAWRK